MEHFDDEKQKHSKSTPKSKFCPILLGILLSMVGITNTKAQSNIPTGAINGLFTVNANGDQVYFSQGNLQYIGSASTPYWKFAENQWDMIGTTTEQNSDNPYIDRDLFGWSTTGYNHGAICFQPWSISMNNTDYYAYGNYSYNLYNQTGKADWGYNSISNGGHQENSGWRTPTREEWCYLFYTRNTTSGIRYVRGQVNGVKGMILLPDDWSSSYYTLNNTNGTSSFTSNIITVSEWSILEQHGAVFLPAGVWRDGSTYNGLDSPRAGYWSSSYRNNSNAWVVIIDNSAMDASGYYNRYSATSVRLVRSAQATSSYSIDAIPNPTEGGTVNGSGTYQQGQTCTLTATANAGYTFTNWTENGMVVSTNTTYSFAVTGSRSLVANFVIQGCIPTGAINGLFTINANGDQVYFSRGNLQYIGSAETPYWKFSDNQWDYIGTIQSGTGQNVDRDLFGWGTSGYNHGATCYQPWNTSLTNSSYYAYGSSTYNLYDQTGQADWGYNPISNGGDQSNLWRILTDEEWTYVLFTRPTNSGIRYAKAEVNGVLGIVLLPNDWSPSYYALNDTNQTGTSNTSNFISDTQWTILEEHGAVFLPAAGGRHGTNAILSGTLGHYWTSNYYNNEDGRYVDLVGYGNENPGQGHITRSDGCSVRLVCPVPALSSYSIEAIPNPTEGGTVNGSGTYEEGQSCTLTAISADGYTFLKWTMNGLQISTDAIYTFTVTESATYIAHFQAQSFVVATSANPTDGGSVAGGGTFAYGESCTITAIPSTGFTFVNWTENGNPVSNSQDYTFTVISDHNLVANFTSQNYVITAIANPTDGGVVTGAGGYNSGDVCTLSATASIGFTFQHWTKNGIEVSTFPTFSFNVTESATYVAHFLVQTYSITVTANPIEGGVVVGGGTYYYGQSCTINVMPNGNYTFVSWTENGEQVSNVASYTFTVNDNHSFVANLLYDTGIEENNNEKIIIFPNPVKDKLTIEASELIDLLEIYNITGALMYRQQNCNETIEINAANYSTGTYLIRLTTNNKVETKKFVKE